MRRWWFDEAFDGGVYAGERGATAGESFVGPLGALGQFEALLGLTGRPLGAGVRVGEALRGLSATTGFWSSSLEADGLATARELLRWADALKLEGWLGEGGPRLEALWAALRDVSPGPADRLARVRARRAELPPLALEVRLLTERIPRGWREALSGALTAALPEPALAGSNLRAARTVGFEPAPDDASLQLIRPHGPLVAADAIASALASEPAVQTLIVGADPVLDAALRRYGLPATGASQTPHDNVLGEVLPLVIELGLLPADPNRAMELLSISEGPVPPKVARRLRRALEQWPAVNSPAWGAQLDEVLAELEDSTALRERLRGLFEGSVSRAASYPTRELLKRAAWLQRWLHARLEYAPTVEAQARLRAAVSQVAMFSNLVDRATVAELSLTQVRRFLEEAHRGMATSAAFPAQAGFRAIAAAGGVIAPIERIVWWNYTRSSSPSVKVPALTSDELRALAASGVTMPSASELARRRAAQERRPFAMATRALWLVAPRHELNGDAATPHPSWDELSARVREPRLVARLVREAPLLSRPVVKTRRAPLAIPTATLQWNANTPLRSREKESPSSVEALLGCSLQWALHYVAGLRGPSTATLALDEQLLGKLAHFVLLERTLRTEHASPTAASTHALETLRAEGPRLAAPLFLPGADAELGKVEQVLRLAAQGLHQLLASGWKVVSTEQESIGAAFGTVFAGIPDLVLERDGRRAVVDLKWSGEGYRRRSLEDGTALQLSGYSFLQGGAEVAYFILTSQAMLSTDPALATGGLALRSEWTAAQTWQLLTTTHADHWASVSRGVLHAPGVFAEPPETSVEDGLVVGPPCRFCAFDGVCGRRYGTVEQVDEED